MSGATLRDDVRSLFSGIEAEAKGRGGPIQPVDGVLEAGRAGAENSNIFSICGFL
jgi:hypothetical protein